MTELKKNVLSRTAGSVKTFWKKRDFYNAHQMSFGIY